MAILAAHDVASQCGVPTVQARSCIHMCWHMSFTVTRSIMTHLVVAVWQSLGVLASLTPTAYGSCSVPSNFDLP